MLREVAGMVRYMGVVLGGCELVKNSWSLILPKRVVTWVFVCDVLLCFVWNVSIAAAPVTGDRVVSWEFDEMPVQVGVTWAEDLSSAEEVEVGNRVRAVGIEVVSRDVVMLAMLLVT